ncbi:MAG: ROK family protein [Microbacteriaceae bacterium]|jgi:polyphosphate glucokinase|nr:ROK family protein [Microbacteriaceae bacterium]MCI1207655.1 ROK family protein [Microbacteriaceae bacterium]
MTTHAHPALGIDIGGTGIKAAVVDTATGTLMTDRQKVSTPESGKPKAILKALDALVAKLDVDPTTMDVGIACPAVVQRGITRTAANISKRWIGLDAQQLFSDSLHTQVAVLNDADAAGYAEIMFGAARGVPGSIILTTLGTGIGSAIVVNGTLIPNTELGHLDIGEHPNIEHYAANSARERENLGMEEWAERLQLFYEHLESVFWPDLFVVGGGISRQHEDFLPLLHLHTPIVPAQHRNSAGLLGAAAFAASHPEASPTGNPVNWKQLSEA